MNKFWNLFVVCVILVGSLVNPLSNVNTSKALLSLKDDITITTVGHQTTNLVTKKVESFDKGLFIYYEPLKVSYETPHIRWERES